MKGRGQVRPQSAEMVRKADQLRAADLLSRVASAVVKCPSTGLLKQLDHAQAAYEATK